VVVGVGVFRAGVAVVVVTGAVVVEASTDVVVVSGTVVEVVVVVSGTVVEVVVVVSGTVVEVVDVVVDVVVVVEVVDVDVVVSGTVVEVVDVVVVGNLFVTANAASSSTTVGPNGSTVTDTAPSCSVSVTVQENPSGTDSNTAGVPGANGTGPNVNVRD